MDTNQDQLSGRKRVKFQKPVRASESRGDNRDKNKRQKTSNERAVTTRRSDTYDTETNNEKKDSDEIPIEIDDVNDVNTKLYCLARLHKIKDLRVHSERAWDCTHADVGQLYPVIVDHFKKLIVSNDAVDHFNVIFLALAVSPTYASQFTHPLDLRMIRRITTNLYILLQGLGVNGQMCEKRRDKRYSSSSLFVFDMLASVWMS